MERKTQSQLYHEIDEAYETILVNLHELAHYGQPDSDEKRDLIECTVKIADYQRKSNIAKEKEDKEKEEDDTQ